jgi:hypothetical protein
MSALPEFALSIRQPWAWAVIHAGKDIENRSWKPGNPGLKFRGPVAIHAAQGMTEDEYLYDWRDIRYIAKNAGKPPEEWPWAPAARDLNYGGIVGVATITDIVTSSLSPWFFGRQGLVLTDVQPVPFLRCQGALGFFKWKHEAALAPVKLAKWMTG